MADRELNVANAFETTLDAQFGPTDLTATVKTTSGAPTSPCILAIGPENDSKREYIIFDGVFTGTTFVTSVIGNRYLEGSAAGSGITHETGTVVRAVVAAQLLEDLHDRIDNNFSLVTTGDAPGHTHDAAYSRQRTLAVDVFMTAAAHSGWDSNAVVTSALNNGYKIGSATLGDYIEWDVTLDAGTWTIEVMHRTLASGGQIAVKLDGTTLGTVETYSASAIDNVRTAVSGVAVASGGVKRLRLEVTGKHASSTNYNGQINGLQLRRTA